jgi:hypothetical protein
MTSSCVSIQPPFLFICQPEDIIGISPHLVETNVIVTLKSSAIHIYNLLDQKCVLSWRVGLSLSLTLPTVQHPVNGCFFCVANNNTLYVWDSSSTSIETNLFQTSEDSILGLHIHKDVSEPILILSNGKVSTLCTKYPSDVKASLSSPPPDIGNIELLLYSEVGYISTDGPLYLLAIYKTNIYFILLYELSKNGLFIVYQQQLNTENSKLFSVSFDFESKRLVWLDEKERLCVSHLILEGQKETSFLLISKFKRNLSLYSGHVLDQKRWRADLIAFNRSYVCISGTSTDNKNILSVFETDYGTLLQSDTFSSTENNVLNSNHLSKKRHSEEKLNCFLFKIRVVDCDYFIAVDGSNATIFPIVTRELLTADLLGNLNKTKQFLRDPENMLAPFQSEQDAILQMLKLMEQRNEDEFMKAFSVYTQKTSDSKNSVYSYFFVCSFLRACVDQKEILLESAIKTVLESGFCSYQACPELLSFLLERKAIDLLELYFLHVSDIPESQIVDLLNFAVNQDNDAFLLEYFSQHWSVARKKLQPPYEKPGDVLLALAFSSARNDNFLLSALKKIPIESTLKLLRFAVCWIRRYASNEERVAKKLTAALRAPSYLQVLDWLAVLLDSHLPRLVLFAETRQCLLEIAGVVTCELKILAGLLDLMGFLLQFESKIKLTTLKVPLYSVEILHL